MQRYLRIGDFPARTETLLTQASEAGGPSDVLSAIDQLPSRRYGDLDELSIALARLHGSIR